MTPIEGHELRRASADCFLCGCGMGFVMCTDQRVAERRHNQHVDEIRKHRATVKDAQVNGIQSTLVDDGQESANWCNPFGQGLFRKP